MSFEQLHNTVSKMRHARYLLTCLLLVIASALMFVTSPAHSQSAKKLQPPSEIALAAKLARAFRIDLSDVSIELDFFPQDDRLDGTTLLTFSMRDGQTRPLFHFNPLRKLSQNMERKFLKMLTLDSQTLDPQNHSDLRSVRGATGAELAFEIQRDLGPGEHTLEVLWSIPHATASIPKEGKRHQGWLYPIFDDTEGPSKQTETLWPTVSSPEELARHRIVLRVHDAESYTVIGSGVVDPSGANSEPQAWTIDTEQAISSSNVFFAAVPSSDVLTTEFEVSDVNVTIVTDRTQKALVKAEKIARKTITQLVNDLGNFPVPNVHVLLTHWPSGMEYYGATRTGLGALEHELVHMYFGTVTVNRTWRDTWFDEAAVEWWQAQDKVKPLPPKFKSNLARDRPVAAPGFDLRAYGAGPRILGRVAKALGGTNKMLDFLRDLHERRAFKPFTTDDLITDIVKAQNKIKRSRLERWLYGT